VLVRQISVDHAAPAALDALAHAESLLHRSLSGMKR
jgi:hypothetical protein